MNITTLFLIMLVALLGPALAGFRRFPIPIIVGEILAGVILGPTVLHRVDPTDPSTVLLSNVGFAMLMFLVGSNLPLRDANIRKAFGRGTLGVLLAFVAAIPLALLVDRLTGFGHPQMLVLLFANSSAGAVMPVLNERNLTGPTVLYTTAWVALADAVTLIALPLALTPAHLAQAALGAGVVSVAGFLGYLVLRYFKSWEMGQHYRGLSKERRWALDLRMSVVLVLGLTALALAFGVSISVAGFAAGAAVMFLDQPGRYRNQLIGVAQGYFVPAFFVILGAKLNIPALIHSAANVELLVSLVVASIIAHVVVARLIRLPVASGLTASAQQGLPAAIVSLGLASNAITSGQGSAIICAAVVLLLSCSVGTALLARKCSGDGECIV